MYRLVDGNVNLGRMKIETRKLKLLDPAFIAFLPFGTLAIHFLYESIPLGWACLASLLETVSLVSLYFNVIASDVFWSFCALYAFTHVSLPGYFDTVNTMKNKNIACERNRRSDKVVFSELSKMVYSDVFSCYKIALLAKIPLVIQLVAAGSVLYSIFGLDFVLHALAGFGVGAISVKVYKTAVNGYGYNKLASYFGLDRFESFKTERKWATAEWTLFCLVVTTLSWELMERIVYFMSVNNAFRVGLECVWNSVGDLTFGILGGMIAWYLIERKLHWA